jgi:hypothetical protein
MNTPELLENRFNTPEAAGTKGGCIKFTGICHNNFCNRFNIGFFGRAGRELQNRDKYNG